MFLSFLSLKNNSFISYHSLTQSKLLKITSKQKMQFVFVLKSQLNFTAVRPEIEVIDLNIFVYVVTM